MGKYVIESKFENTRCFLEVACENREPYFFINRVDSLTPYTEPDLDAIRKEAYQKGIDAVYEDAETIYKNNREVMYQKGLKDAWNAARKIYLPIEYGGIPADVLRQMFDNKSASGIFKKVSASEAVEKIRQYEQRQEEQIQVGDEIETPSGLRGYVVNFTDDELVHYVSSEGRFGTMGISAVSKTGRHFPEIAEVLQKMKES